eukprot:2343403-Pleurochrysis_carterae.AAC.1
MHDALGRRDGARTRTPRAFALGAFRARACTTRRGEGTALAHARRVRLRWARFACALRALARRVGAKKRRLRTHAACACALRALTRAACTRATRGGHWDGAHRHI